MTLSLCRDLALVVREDQVVPSAVQIERRAQVLDRHHGALDVPAGSTHPEGGSPRRLVGQGPLPEHEVEGGSTVRVVGTAATRGSELDHPVGGVVRQLAEALERRHVEVHGAVRHVRVAAIEQLTDHLDHPVDRLRRPRFGDRRAHAERVHVGAEARQLFGCELEVGHTELPRLREDRVVDVGDVAHHPHLVAELFEPPGEQVVRQVRRGVAEMRRVVGRDPADVHRDHGPDVEVDDAPLCRVEDPHSAGRVVEAGEMQRARAVVTEVDGEEQRRERLDPHGVGE